MRVVSERENIVRAHFPLRKGRNRCLVFAVRVVRRRRVEGDHWPTLRGIPIHVVDNLVQIMKPVISILVLKYAKQ